MFGLQIALGTVTNVEEAVKWISYTYLYVRMRANPLVYGISHKAYQVGNSFVKKTPALSFCYPFLTWGKILATPSSAENS